MKVIPHIKHRQLENNEIRVITIKNNAIRELLLENLMEHKDEYFDVDGISDKHIFLMNWNPKEEFLSYAVVPFKLFTDGKQLNFDYIYQKFGATTDSLFKHRCYRSLTVNEKMFVRSDNG